MIQGEFILEVERGSPQLFSSREYFFFNYWHFRQSGALLNIILLAWEAAWQQETNAGEFTVFKTKRSLRTKKKETDLERRASQLLPKTSLHLPSSRCRLKWSNIPSLSLFVSGFQRRWGICSHAVHQISCHPPTITSERGRNMSMEAG